MPRFLVTIFQLLICFCAIVWIYRFRNIDLAHSPFLNLNWIWCTSEVTTAIFYNYQDIPFVNNIHFLVEPQIILWQLNKWPLFKKYQCLSLQPLFVMVWMSGMGYVQKNEFLRTIFFVCIYRNVCNISYPANWRYRERQNKFACRPGYNICGAFILYFTFTSFFRFCDRFIQFR
jgi:hypothetical protein